MNREIKTVKVKSRGKVFTEICYSTPHSEFRVGSQYCINKCPHFVRVLDKNGRQYVHCNKL